MSPRGLPRRAQISWRPPSECEDPAGGVRRIWLVGKQTAISNRTTSAAPSFPAASSSRSVLLYRARPEPCLPRQAGCLARLRHVERTRSAVLRLLRSSSIRTRVRSPRKPFSLHELPSGIRTKVLTGGRPERYIAVCRGRSRRGGLSKSPNGPVAGLSPEILESAV